MDRLRVLGVFAAVGVAVAAFAPLANTSARASQDATTHSLTAGSAPGLFARSSFWNQPLSLHAPLDRRSPQLSGSLRREARREVQAGTGPWIETTRAATPIYVVPADQPTVRVHLDDGDAEWRRTLQRAFNAVPIPPNARASGGSDAYLTIWQRSTDKLWEFFQARKDADGHWHASWGGAMRHVSKSPGYFTRESWPGASFAWGATATSLPLIGGTIRLGELQRGRIRHALAISIPEPRAGVFSWPAQRADGAWASARAIPEGARFRLDPSLRLGRLHLPPLVDMMARAVKRYGMVVRDRSGGGIGFFFQNTVVRPGPDPFWTEDWEPRPDGYLGGEWPSRLLAKFPWEHLRLLKMKTCASQSWEPCPWPR